MKGSAKLSVGIPAYNQGQYLASAIRSLLEQTVQPLEIVVSDNLSTDVTSLVLEQFKGRIRIVRPPSHMGMMEHWNFLVSKMQGEWFSILSCDDIAKPNFVSTLLKGIQRDDNAILVRAGWETINEAGKVLERRYLLSVRAKTYPPKTLYEQLQGPKLNFSAFAVKKSMWAKVDGFPEVCALNGDWGFWIRLSPYGVFVYEHEIISQYRSAYRPNLEKFRLLRELGDELEIYAKLIPEAANVIPNVNQSKILSQTRIRFKRRVSQASRWLGDGDRARATHIFHAWNNACYLMCDTDLSDFRKGKQLNYAESFGVAKKIARYIYSWLR